MKITAQQNGSVSRPMLIHVNKINYDSKQKDEEIVYYQLPFTFQYQSIQKLKNSDLFLSDFSITYKIVNYVKKTEQIVEPESSIEFQPENRINIVTKTKQGSIQIEGTIINKASQLDTFADISLKSIQGYEKYYQFRKKYKTLENITRKINFSLDHRLKLVCENIRNKKEFFFSLDELKNKEINNIYNEIKAKTKLQFQFQQIISIGDTNIESIVEQGSFQFDTIQTNNSYDLILQMSQHLKITLSLKIIKNKNLAKFQFVALRVLQTSQKEKSLKIGNQETINSSSSVIQIQPLLENRFYDYQYGYLSQNLNQIKKMGQNQELYKYLDKLTSSKEKYQHFINQKVIDLSQSKNIVFSINNNDLIQIPVTYILEGYNSFCNENWSIKFLLEVVDSENHQKSSNQSQIGFDNKFQVIPKKLFQLKIKQMLNIGQIATIIEKNLISKENSFYFKIKCQTTIYTVEFQISTVKKTQFKKQAQQLQLKTEFLEIVDGNLVLLKKTENPQNLCMIRSLNLQPFYLIQLTDSSSISFDISTKKHIIMHGQIKKKQFYQSGSQFDKKIILSLNGHGNSQQKSVISFSFKQISQNIEGPSFNFKVKYCLTAAKVSGSSPVYYGLQILRIVQETDPKKRNKRSDKNKLQQKIQLQVLDSQLGECRIKQFSGNRSCFIQKKSNLKLLLKLKRIHYDVDLNTFDNSQLIERTILLNRNIKDKIDEGILTFQLPSHHFRQFQFDAYDEQINQKITLKLEIYYSKQPFSVGDQHVYRIKVPHLLWNMNKLKTLNQHEPKIQIQTLLSNKNKTIQSKQLIYNSAQELSLPHFNYSDGISVKITYENGAQDVGYCKVRDSLKAKYEITKDQLRQNEDSQWYLGAVPFTKSSFYFLIKMQFDPNADRQSSNESRATQKTKSKQKKQTSNQKGCPDIFAKTLKSVDVITKLKITKNNLNEQLRQLTSKYVQRETMITYLKKKITEIDEQNKRKKQEMQSAVNETKKKPKSKLTSGQKPKNSIYRDVCQCGERDQGNIQWGYCVKCIGKLRQKYETFFRQYQESSIGYEKAMFKKFSLRDKIDSLKQKIQSYRNIMKGGDEGQNLGTTPLQVQAAHERMEQKQLALQVQELKLQIFDLERERQSQFQRRAYQMNELQKKIKKQEDELWAKSQELNDLNLKLKQVQQQIKQNQKNKNDDFE